MFTVHNLGRIAAVVFPIIFTQATRIAMYRYHVENVFVRGFPLHRAGYVPCTALPGHSGGTTGLGRRRKFIK